MCFLILVSLGVRSSCFPNCLLSWAADSCYLKEQKLLFAVSKAEPGYYSVVAAAAVAAAEAVAVAAFVVEPVASAFAAAAFAAAEVVVAAFVVAVSAVVAAAVL